MLKQRFYVSAVGITDGFEAKTVDPTISDANLEFLTAYGLSRSYGVSLI